MLSTAVAARGVSGLGVCLPGGCLPRGCLPKGVSAWGMSAQGVEGCLPRLVSTWGCLPRGCLPGGVCPGGCLPWGVCQTPPPPVNRMTDRHLWKYYLATTSLRTVISVPIRKGISRCVQQSQSIIFQFNSTVNNFVYNFKTDISITRV